jgi:5'-AMP-activated protein kinase regulatory gamma subunit
MAHQAAHQMSQGSGGGGPSGHPAMPLSPSPAPPSPGKSSLPAGPIPPPVLHPAAMHASPSPPPISTPIDMEMTAAPISSSGTGGGGGGIGGGQTGDSAGTGGVDGVLAPIAAQVEEPQYTRKKVKEFLTHHSAYELIPESGKVVLLDIDLPLRQAFHALHEQGLASAPLYCSESGTIAGIVSASDFIATLQRLRSMVSTSSNPMSEQEMDQHTIRGLREEMTAEGRPPKGLVSVAPGNSLAQVVRTMYENHCSMAPVLQHGPNGALVREGSLGGAASGGGGGGAGSTAAASVAGGDDCDGPEVLHTASLSGVLACLMRHFRASLASLPLLAQPLHSLPVGTWNPESPVALQGTGAEETQPAIEGVQRRGRRIVPIKTVHHTTPLNEAMGLLIEAGISCLPVVDDTGALIDIYARSDVTMLAKSNAYNRLQFEDVTVGQALALTAEPGPPPQLSVTQPAAPPPWPSPNSSTTSMHDAAMAASSRQRVHVCTSQDALRYVVDRLATPGVRRVFVVHAETRRVEGIVSLSDVASFLLL